TFSYPGAIRPALRDVTFALPPGSKLGLVGPVGGGKTTLLALLLGFYEPPRGQLFVDGHDVVDLAPDVLRGLFAYAAQDPFLFSDAVTANVTFSASATDTERLERAVVSSALDQDLPQLPKGMATIVGERGVTLSGGQKQRVALARALYEARPALLLDDTLSAVDTLTERRILHGLAQQRGTKTVIVATHRLSAIADADLVLVLVDGAVAEHGTPGELAHGTGPYAAAWRLQTEADALESRPEEAP
ncbi:MAG: hypothetical protein RL398_1781, partial [Planctomycetota bacterium]